MRATRSIRRDRSNVRGELLLAVAKRVREELGSIEREYGVSLGDWFVRVFVEDDSRF